MISSKRGMSSACHADVSAYLIPVSFFNFSFIVLFEESIWGSQSENFGIIALTKNNKLNDFRETEP
jgi:hypothetical protein